MADNPETGWAVEVVRGGQMHCGFWHCALNKAPREAGMYDGVPFVQPINARQYPALVFASEFEAGIAADYFNSLWGRKADRQGWREDMEPGEYVGRARAVNAAPSHVLSDCGFQAVPLAGLFA